MPIDLFIFISDLVLAILVHQVKQNENGKCESFQRTFRIIVCNLKKQGVDSLS